MPAPRKKLEVLKLHGTYRRDRHGDRNPPKVKILEKAEPPAWLTGPAKELFCAKADELIDAGILANLDIEMLAIFASLYQAGKESLEAGEPVKASHFAIVRNLAGDLGLTPMSRQRLSIKPMQEEANEFDEI